MMNNTDSEMMNNTDSDYQFRVMAAALIGEDVDWPDEDEDDANQDDCHEPDSGLFGDY